MVPIRGSSTTQGRLTMLCTRGWFQAFSLLMIGHTALNLPIFCADPFFNFSCCLLWCVYSLMAMGLSFEFTEVILAVCWNTKEIPLSTHVINRARTAVVMTVCDDADGPALEALKTLSYAGFPVFLLNNSIRHQPHLAALSSAFLCIVDGHRSNVQSKSKSLNCWLHRFGHQFDNLILSGFWIAL